MLCTNCGEEVKNGMKYCPKCGCEVKYGKGSVEHGSGTIFSDVPSSSNKVESKVNIKPVNDEKDTKKKRKKGSKIKRFLCAVIAVILIIGISGLVFYIKSPSRQIVSKVKKGEYTTVKQLYNSGVKDKFVQEMLLQKLVKNDCNSIVDDFKTNKVNFDEAIEKLDAYASLGDKKIADYLSKKSKVVDDLNTSMNSYAKAEKLYESGKYAEALEKYALVVKEDDNYKDAQEKLSKCVEKYREAILSKTENPSSQTDYETAIETLNIALKIVPDDDKLTARLNELESGYADLLKSEALTNGTQYIQEGKFEELFTILNKACEMNSGDAELENLKKTAEDEFVKKVQADVDGYLTNDNYDEAIKYLKNANKILADNSTLSELLQKTQNNVPVQLSSLKISESDRCEEGSNLTLKEDSIGNVYSSGNLFKLDSYGTSVGYMTFYIKGDYSRLTGTIAVADDSSKTSGMISIYDENDKLLYTSGDMSRTTAPIKVDVDIKGVQWLKISAQSDDFDSFKCLIADFMLYKE